MTKFKISTLKLKILLGNKFFRWNILFKCGKNVTIAKNVDIRLRKSCELTIGDFSYIGEGSLLDCEKGGKIEIGRNTLLFKHVFVVARDSIKIGDNCLIAEFSSIRDSDHSFVNITIPIYQQGFNSARIFISEDVWIGKGAAVLKGVKIGEHTIIGANSVVTKDIPSMSIAVGVPAKVTKNLCTNNKK
jgi:acetyltransferase-like isoleucine patch superfamily enzyme